MQDEERLILDNLRKSIFEYNKELSLKYAKMCVDMKMDPFEALNVMTDAIREIGDAFGRNELWLPDLVGGAGALQTAMPILEEAIGKKGAKRETLGVIVIGTVFGDIHSIGKTMVATLLIASGFKVIDLGVNITADSFLEAVKKYDADLLALSALMTTTCAEQKKVIDELKSKGLRERVKVMVGGAAVTAKFTESIGADGYDPTAPGAMALAKKLISSK